MLIQKLPDTLLFHTIDYLRLFVFLLNPIPTRLCHMIFHHGDKKYSYLVGIGLNDTVHGGGCSSVTWWLQLSSVFMLTLSFQETTKLFQIRIHFTLTVNLKKTIVQRKSKIVLGNILMLSNETGFKSWSEEINPRQLWLCHDQRR